MFNKFSKMAGTIVALVALLVVSLVPVSAKEDESKTYTTIVPTSFEVALEDNNANWHDASDEAEVRFKNHRGQVRWEFEVERDGDYAFPLTYLKENGNGKKSVNFIVELSKDGEILSSERVSLVDYSTYTEAIILKDYLEAGKFTLTLSSEDNTTNRVVIQSGVLADKEDETDEVPDDDKDNPGQSDKKEIHDFDFAFIYGYDDTYFAPDNNVTREEASSVLYRILKQSDQLDPFHKSQKSGFPDVEDGKWSLNALTYMQTVGALDAHFVDENNNVLPTQPLTRGEVAHIISVSMGFSSDGNYDAPDITDSIFADEIDALYDEGILRGKDGSGNYYPEDNLTRAEFTRMINVMLDRNTENYNISDIECPFTDLDKTEWYYPEILLGSNAFTDGQVDYEKRIDRNTLDME